MKEKENKICVGYFYSFNPALNYGFLKNVDLSVKMSRFTILVKSYKVKKSLLSACMIFLMLTVEGRFTSFPFPHVIIEYKYKYEHPLIIFSYTILAYRNKHNQVYLVMIIYIHNY